MKFALWALGNLVQPESKQILPPAPNNSSSSNDASASATNSGGDPSSTAPTAATTAGSESESALVLVDHISSQSDLSQPTSPISPTTNNNNNNNSISSSPMPASTTTTTTTTSTTASGTSLNLKALSSFSKAVGKFAKLKDSASEKKLINSKNNNNNRMLEAGILTILHFILSSSEFNASSCVTQWALRLVTNLAKIEKFKVKK